MNWELTDEQLMLLFISREDRIRRMIPSVDGQAPTRRVSNAQLFEQMGYKPKVVRPGQPATQ